MDLNYVDGLIDDDEVPELTEEDFARMVSFHQLPPDHQEFLLQVKHATIRPDPVKEPVTVAISTDVLRSFTASGAGWEARLDGALRQWLKEHPLSLPKAS